MMNLGVLISGRGSNLGAILAASACSVTELVGMKDELVALRDRLNAALSE